MRISDMNWMQVEKYLTHDDRAILPLGSTEQHAYLSLSTDAILAQRLSLEAAEPQGIPVFPVQPYGLTPYFKAFPGTITLRMETYVGLIRDLLDGLAASGFKRILIVNGHVGNTPAHAVAIEWMADNPGVVVKFHNWWSAPKTSAKIRAIDPVGAHASWMENFPWTRLPGVTVPSKPKPMVDEIVLRLLNPKQVRAYLGDGSYGGSYQHPDADMKALWSVAVEEVREVLEGPWGTE